MSPAPWSPKRCRRSCSICFFAGLVFIALAASSPAVRPSPAAAGATGGSFGLAMIFVLLTYGGWNEAAYLAGEVRDPHRNMMRILVGGILTVTVVYLLVNLGYLAALGLGGMKESKAVAADVVRAAGRGKGRSAGGARRLPGRADHHQLPRFSRRENQTTRSDATSRCSAKLGTWRESGSTPANALVLQGVIALVLVGASSITPDGFTAMVA